MTQPSKPSIGPECIEDDLEKYAGEVIPDPWLDDSQTDWPNAEPIVVEQAIPSEEKAEPN